MPRVFKNKWFVRFARKEGIEDSVLCETIRSVETGLIDADLGGGVIKQRVARSNQGKSTGFRVIILFRANDRAFFVYGFAKSERDDLRANELAGFKALADEMFGYDKESLERALKNGALVEVHCNGKEISK
ncbi:MAG: type II toxin-antitoxin system RelE/ParE family toxin [Pseudomonadales bacterium]|nr:type II toxin-antitoxin system RelE/ParE family toxin [Pseudomonadales bacterium]